FRGSSWLVPRMACPFRSFDHDVLCDAARCLASAIDPMARYWTHLKDRRDLSGRRLSHLDQCDRRRANHRSNSFDVRPLVWRHKPEDLHHAPIPHLNPVTPVALPTPIPFTLAGLRIGLGRALVGMVVSEMVASRGGIGHMMSTAGQ